MMVILRLSLGCHFLYEGVWKLTHPEFSAEGFLTQAKGPAAWIFHALVPDIDGTERLKIEKVAAADPILEVWKKTRDDSQLRYQKRVTELCQAELKEDEKLSKEDERAMKESIRAFRIATDMALWQHEDKLDQWLAVNEPAVLAAFTAVKKGPTAEEKERLADELKTQLGELGTIEKEYHQALRDLAEADKHAKQAKDSVARSLKAVIPSVEKGLPVDKVVVGNAIRNPDGRLILHIRREIKGSQVIATMNNLKLATAKKYGLNDGQRYQAEKGYRRYKRAVKEYLAENQEDIAAYLGSLQRLQEVKAGGNRGAAHQKQRLWDEQQKLRKEVGNWLAELDAAESGYQDALWSVLSEQQQARGALPAAWKLTDLTNFAVSYGLTAIGFCLLIGFCTRPAAIGGGLFMISVLLTQPAWPSIYPPAPPVVGHALIVNKDFVEMIALFLVATTAAGRWGGLDCFFERFVVRLYQSRKHHG